MKIMGLPVWGILAGGVAMYFVGFIWYGLLFSDLWMSEQKLTEADFEGQSSIWMAGGFLISLLSAAGIAKVLKWRGWPDIGGAVQTALVLGVFFGGTFAAYALVYGPLHSWPLFFVDAGHMIVSGIVAAIVITALK